MAFSWPFATLALSLSQIRGLQLGGDRLGQIVQHAMASASPEELRSPHGITTAALGRLDGLLTSAMASGPLNQHSAEAARLAQLGAHGAAAILGHKGYAELQRTSRDAARDARGGGESGSGSDRSPSSGSRYSGLPAAGDGVPPTVMNSYVQQYNGTGFGRDTVKTFAQIGLERPQFDEFRKEGFNNAQIADNAKDVKSLGWKGKEQVAIGQHALPEARKAAIAVEKADTPEKLAEAQRQEVEAKKKADALPKGDRRKAVTQQFFQELIRTSKKPERHKAFGASATQADASKAEEKSPLKAAQDANADQLKKTTVAVVKTNALAAFDIESEKPKPPKSKFTKTAAVKPTAPISGKPT